MRERFLFNRELRLRLASAAILIPAALVATFAGGVAYVAFVLLGSVLVLHEWLRMIGAGRLYHLHIACGLLLLLLAIAAYELPLWLSVAAVLAAAAAATVAAWRDRSDIAARWVFVGVAYLGLAIATLIGLRRGEDGFAAVAFVFLIAWASDTGAFFVGRKLRGPKLWAKVSPSKTWSGAIGGLVSGVAAGALVAAMIGATVSAATLLVAALLVVASQAGDLLESAAKRYFMIKDAGTLIPGHGGVMDRVDGIVAAIFLGAVLGVFSFSGLPATGLLHLIGR
ncbi:MAG: phosphatidate cytidylyltransferase [Acuticoccus sp.]